MVSAIIPNTTRHRSGMAAAKISAAFQSMVKAITMAPNTTKGLRSSRRRVMLMPFCTWFTSLVMRVMRVAEPTLSCAEKSSDWMWANRAWRSRVAKPTAVFAAKYWAVMLQVRPMTANSTSRPLMRRM